MIKNKILMNSNCLKLILIILIIIVSDNNAMSSNFEKKIDNHVISLLYHQKYTKAIDYLEKTIDSLGSDNQMNYHSQCYSYLANCYICLNDISKAELALNSAKDNLVNLSYNIEKQKLYYQYILSWLQYKRNEFNISISITEQTLFYELSDIAFRDSILFFTHNIAGSSYYKLGNIDKAIYKYEESISFYLKNRHHPYEYSKVLVNLANLLGMKGKYNEAIDYLSKSIQVRQDSVNHYPQGIERSFYTLGVLYKNANEYDRALEVYLIAEKIEQQRPSRSLRARIYSGISFIYRSKGDYEKARSYIDNAIFEYSRIKKLPPYTIPKAYNNLGLIQKSMLDYDAALESFNKSIEYFSHKRNMKLAVLYGNCANSYHAIRNFEQAEKYQLKKLDILKESYNGNSLEIVKTYQGLGSLYFVKEDFSKGLKYIEKATKLVLDSLVREQFLLGNCYMNYALYYSKISKPDSALFYYHKALSNYLQKEISNDVLVCPMVEDNQISVSLAKLYKDKAKELNKSGILKDNSLDTLKASMEYYKSALAMIDKLRLSFLDEESKLFLSANEKNTFITTLELAIKLHQLTNDAYYKNLAFELAERGKAANLLASIRSIKAGRFGGIPDSLSAEETNIRREIDIYRKKVFEEKQKETNNTVLIDSLENIFFKLTNRHDDLVRFFEKEYPNYYSLKYDSKVVMPGKIMDFLPDSINFIEYVKTNNDILIFIINNKMFEVFSIPIDKSFRTQTQTIISSLTRVDFNLLGSKDFIAFKEASSYLGSKLIAPIKDKLIGRQLIISVDEALSYIPFEILIDTKSDNKGSNYRNLAYLIRAYSISYAYSATLLLEDNREIRKAKAKLVAFAPNYGNEINNSINSDGNQFVLFPLPKAYEEASSIVKQTNGEIFNDSLATEANFILQKDEFKVLHLAMHAIIENHDPMFSRLVFSQGDDSLNDRFLYAYEVYNMSIPAQLSVLSACNTGDGKVRKGEGVMSFARSFIYAGCPSVVMTLWPVEDNAGSGIMIDFYKYLLLGNSIDESLRQAKLDYLKTADLLHSHPYFWAEYVIIGDNSPVFRKRNNYLNFILGGFLLIITFIIVQRKRKQSSL
ncbi:MAG: CHAT domain-containing protein [Bacteroidota bacterium]|nr:CHAT domain-containing protein [Bacteroidota bacterium]